MVSGPVHRFLAPLIVMLLFCHPAAGEDIKCPVWCVANPAASDAELQAGLNYACGEGGVNCSPIQPGRQCFEPNTIRDHASFAYNNFFHMKDLDYRCDFNGSAMYTNTDPSTPNCGYPSSGCAGVRNIGEHMAETGENA